MENIEIVHDSNPDGAFKPTRIIAVAVENTSNESLITWLCDGWLNKNTDEVILMNVRSQVSPAYAGGIGTEHYMSLYSDANRIGIEQNLKLHSHQLLNKLAQPLIQNNYHVKGLALVGDAREEIENKLDQIKPTLVVVGSSNKNMLGRMVLGSVSNYIVNTGKYPVLVYKHN